jgi:hypothetical protein
MPRIGPRAWLLGETEVQRPPERRPDGNLDHPIFVPPEMASSAGPAADSTSLRKTRADAPRDERCLPPATPRKAGVCCPPFAIGEILPLNQSRTLCRFRALRLDRQLPCSRVVNKYRTPSRYWVLISLFILALAPRPRFAQEASPPSQPPGWITPTPKGLVAEPALLRKLVGTSESTVGDEKEPADGLYVETGNMITGEGRISAGPGYRRHVLDDRMLIDVSAVGSSCEIGARPRVQKGTAV